MTMEVRCKVFGHKWRIKQRSNVIQFDEMGYPLRLFICECKYCMKSEQMWIDSTECKNDVVLQWSDDDYVPIPPKARKNEAYADSKVNVVLDKLSAEIKSHCGLTKENQCHCAYCNRVMGVGEILEIIDKCKAESEGKNEDQDNSN